MPVSSDQGDRYDRTQEKMSIPEYASSAKRREAVIILNQADGCGIAGKASRNRVY
jgi:hypothetical protein